MHEMMDSRIWKQRREELLREVELTHQARALRATRKRGAALRSALVWEMKSHTGRIFKRLRNAG